jgi:hypothetical protein
VKRKTLRLLQVQETSLLDEGGLESPIFNKALFDKFCTVGKAVVVNSSTLENMLADIEDFLHFLIPESEDKAGFKILSYSSLKLYPQDELPEDYPYAAEISKTLRDLLLL